MLHFGGKSTYASESEKDRQKAREKHFREIFQNKWGEELHKILMDEDAKVSILVKMPVKNSQIADIEQELIRYFIRIKSEVNLETN